MAEMNYVTAGRMKELDREAAEKFGIPASVLMENAGRALAEEAMKLNGPCAVAVFCGFGNNGGDGLVAARYLAEKKYGVSLYMVGAPRALSPETNANLEKALSAGLRPGFISSEDGIGDAFGKMVKPPLVIDAIFGIGLRGDPGAFYRALFDKINGLGSKVIAADIPSGLDADTGEASGAAVKAAETVTFGYPKIGFKNPSSGKYTGRVIVRDIGLPGQQEAPVISRIEKKAGCVILRSGKKGRVRKGHPWIFKGQLRRPEISVRPADLVSVLDGSGKFVGKGYYNPRSIISVRMITFRDEAIDKEFFAGRIARAAEKRRGLAPKTDAYRAVFSEADGIPGLIVDVYGNTAVFQALTLGIDRRKDVIVDAIRQALAPEFVYEKSVSPFRKIEGLKDTAGWWGAAGRGLIRIREGAAKFMVDIENGHKTGFYLDQRAQREALKAVSKGKAVLDLFCYTGSFSVVAALSGAASVTGVDIKERWLELARENASLNEVAQKTEFVKDDAFMALRRMRDAGRMFDMIIIDPPSFLKSRHSLASASKGYRELNTLAMKMLPEGGILATFSCSHNMPNESFSGILKESAAASGKKISILKRCHQAEDHPIARSIPETGYLKGYFLKINSV